MSPAPVGVFTNPSSGGIAGNAQVEALAIVGKQICHIARNHETHGGWSVVPLFGGQAAEQVAAGVASSGEPDSAVYGLFVDGDNLYSTTLGADGSSWSKPVAIPGGAMSRPRAAYSPDGEVVFYGVNSKGDLVTAYQPKADGPFTSVVCSVNGALGQGNLHLCMNDESSFTILANINNKPWLITGSLGATESNSIGEVPNFTETLEHVALGYYNSTKNTMTFLLVTDDGTLHSWSLGADNSPVVQKIPHSSVSQATGHVSQDQDGNPLLNVYAIDKDLGLWSLHQCVRNSWNDDGSPRWAPILPLGRGVSRVASDMNPAAAPSLFAIDGGDSSLRLHAKDAGSGMWKTHHLLQHAVQAYEVIRYRAEIRIVDSHGARCPDTR